MSNWVSLNTTHVKTGKLSVLLARVQGAAATRGEADPLPSLIADVVATLRAAVSVGNQLDQDTSKIPNSLKGLAIRMVQRRVNDYLGLELTEAEAAQAKEDQSYLNRIIDNKITFETPDTAAGSAEMQKTASVDVIASSNRDNYTRAGMEGFL